MQAVRCNGNWFVRIDDIDPPRIKQDAISDILGLLDACGFFNRKNNGAEAFPHRDSGLSSSTTAVTLQSQCTQRYDQALGQLVEKNAVFACQCSRSQLAGSTTYPGTCRELDLSADQRAVRLRVPQGKTGFVDTVFKNREQNVAREVGDFVVRRRDGLWSYQLASVVDDWHDQVTEVVRGADLLDNTPRQLVLLEKLGLTPPSYLHVPVATDSDGRKLSKQSLAAPVEQHQPLSLIHI